jgi:hypothetical protein
MLLFYSKWVVWGSRLVVAKIATEKKNCYDSVFNDLVYDIAIYKDILFNINRHCFVHFFHTSFFFVVARFHF